MKDFAHQRQIKHTSFVLEPSLRLRSLVKIVDAEVITAEKLRTLDLPLEIINVKSKLESRSLFDETYDSNFEVMFTQSSDQNNEIKHQSLKHCKFCHKTQYLCLKLFWQTTRR